MHLFSNFCKLDFHHIVFISKLFTHKNIYNYLCNKCLSPLKLWVRTPFMARYYTQWLVTGQCFFPGTLVFSINKTDCHDDWNIIECGVKHHKQPTIRISCLLIEYIYVTVKINRTKYMYKHIWHEVEFWYIQMWTMTYNFKVDGDPTFNKWQNWQVSNSDLLRVII
jgi:hypothetical protein